MAQPFSLDDLFAVGIGFDLAGAYLLGRGLIVPPAEAFRRSQARYGFHAGLALGQASDRVDAVAGLTILGGGFFLQALGYVLSLLDVGGGRGWPAAVLAAGLAGLATTTAYVGFHRGLRRRMLFRLLIEFARYDNAGRRHDLPDAHRLQDLGTEYYGTSGTERDVRPGGPALYARRVFGVTAVREGDTGL